jgi:ATP-dependent DNA helicase RecQ
MEIDREFVIKVAEEVITKIAGPEAKPRADQVEAVLALLVAKRRTLVVQHTGWGKSAVYWIAANVVRRQGKGIVLVVSPLLALMRNQVQSANKAGLRAETLNSSNTDDWSDIERKIINNEVDIVFVSPERLANPRFTREVMSVVQDRLGLLVIDEAHCISSWGHDFRPDYQRIACLLMQNPTTPVLCTTATASKRVTKDVANQLGGDTFVLRGQLARESLHLAVVEGLEPVEHYAWVSDALNTLQGSGIIYTLTVDKVQKLTEFLQTQGHNVEAYYGAVPTQERLEIEDGLMRNKLKAVVATSALGMGYDKPDLAFCIHVGCPGSPIDYYQQVGRAGRALEHAVVALVTDQRADKRIWEWFATSNIPKHHEAEAILKFLDSKDGEAKTTEIMAAATLTRPRAELLLKILAVDEAIERTDNGWKSLHAEWIFDDAKYQDLIAERRADAVRMAQYASATECLETQLRIALDDDIDPSTKCGRCSVCTGILPYGLPSTPDREAKVKAQAFLRGVDHVIENRKQWPKDFIVDGVPIRNTRIAAEHQSREGRTLAYADDAAWGHEIETVRFDGHLNDELKKGIDELFARWKPEVNAIVAVPSSSRPVLITDMANYLAKQMGIPIIDALACKSPTKKSGKLGFAERPKDVAKRISLKSSTGLIDAHVLLIDDSCYTRWTLTISGAHLRTGGAKSVTPFTLHQLAGADD